MATGFNGARAGLPWKTNVVELAANESDALQWGQGWIALENNPWTVRSALSVFASMGPGLDCPGKRAKA